MTSVVGRRRLEGQKNRPGVTAPPSPGYCMAICFYYVGLGHMFLLCGAGPYVCIGWLWAICFYCACICVCVYVYMYVCVYMCVYVCMYVCVCVFIGLPHRSEETCWRYISSSNKLKLKCTLTKLCVNDPYNAATLRLVVDSLAVGIKKFEIIVRHSDYLVGSRPIPMEPSTGHMIKYYKYGFTWKLADFICICPYMYTF